MFNKLFKKTTKKESNKEVLERIEALETDLSELTQRYFKLVDRFKINKWSIITNCTSIKTDFWYSKYFNECTKNVLAIYKQIRKSRRTYRIKFKRVSFKTDSFVFN